MMDKRGASREQEQDNAQATALEALAFLASQPEAMKRFMSLTGMGVNDIAAGAASPLFQAALLEHFMSEEALLMSFCADNGLSPDDLYAALTALDPSAAFERPPQPKPRLRKPRTGA